MKDMQVIEDYGKNIEEMNRTGYLIPLTNSEHQRYEKKPYSFFEPFLIKEENYGKC